MTTKIDLKSALCGLALGVLAVLALGAAGLPNAFGRYQVASSASFVTIIDTTTGQAWSANLSSPSPGVRGVPVGFWEKKTRD